MYYILTLLDLSFRPLQRCLRGEGVSGPPLTHEPFAVRTSNVVWSIRAIFQGLQNVGINSATFVW